MMTSSNAIIGIASDPSSPVYAGEMQMFALGMDVDVADPLTGNSIIHVSWILIRNHSSQLFLTAVAYRQGSLGS